MLGVVLWSNASERKAVIWCEDQGDLAYVNADVDDLLWQGDFFDAGDLVQFEVKVHKSLRVARNTRLVAERAGSDLPNALMEGARNRLTVPEVVPFARNVEPRDEDAGHRASA